MMPPAPHPRIASGKTQFGSTSFRCLAPSFVRAIGTRLIVKGTQPASFQSCEEQSCGERCRRLLVRVLARIGLKKATDVSPTPCFATNGRADYTPAVFLAKNITFLSGMFLTVLACYYAKPFRSLSVNNWSKLKALCYKDFGCPTEKNCSR